LLKGKRAILVLARGGVYSNGPTKPFDFQEPYLRSILGFIGIIDVDVVYIEGVADGAIGPENSCVGKFHRVEGLLTARSRSSRLCAFAPTGMCSTCKTQSNEKL
jgi:FMN-dependent NADH-azoreductase